MLAEEYLKESFACGTPCKPVWHLDQTSERILDHLPLCSTRSKDWSCLLRSLDKAKKKIKTLIPCAALKYKGSQTPFNPGGLEKSAKFILMIASPGKVLVREEYLVFDGVATIGAIGGTMGLCIGLSFFQMGSVIMMWLDMVITVVKNMWQSNKISQNPK